VGGYGCKTQYIQAGGTFLPQQGVGGGWGAAWGV